MVFDFKAGKTKKFLTKGVVSDYLLTMEIDTTTDESETINIKETTHKIPEGQMRIMETAIEEFASKGFASASTRDIAEKAGVSEALIFKYYHNKKNLFQKVVFPHIFNLLAPLAVNRVAELLKQNHSTFREFAMSLLRERIEFVLTHTNYLKILLQEIFINEELQSNVQEQFYELVWPIMEKKIQQYQKTGELRKIAPERIFRMMLSLFMGLVVSAAIIKYPYENLQEECEITIDVLMSGIASCDMGVRHES